MSSLAKIEFYVPSISLIILALILLFAAVVRCQNATKSVWVNELGSQVVFFADSNLLTGYYTTHVGSTNSRTLTGFTSKIKGITLMTWSVLFDSPFSVAAWTGYCSRNVLSTHWILTSHSGAWWNSTLIGEDIFHRSS